MTNVHFEIHATDVEAAKAFYSGLFGWTIEPMPGGEDMGYHLISGDRIGSTHQLTGGLMRRIGDPPNPGAPIRGCTLTIEVADVDDRYAWALANGGAEAMPPTDFPGIGRFAHVEDGQGNVIGFIRPVEE